MVIIYPDVTWHYMQDGRPKKGFYMNEWLKSNIDNYFIKAVEAKWDCVVLITGMEGCQPKDSKVLMSNGTWKNIQDIKKGDTVISPQKDGTNLFSKVISTTKWYSKKNYEITTLNKHKKKLYTCSYNHIIPINYNYKPRNKNQERHKENFYWGIKNYTAEQYSKIGKKSLYNRTTLTSFPIYSFQESINPDIDPYILGIYLGDGSFCKSNISITTADNEIINYISSKYIIDHIYDKKNTTCKNIRFKVTNKLSIELKKLGLEEKRSDVKFIPRKALLSDYNFRLHLFAGLIDSDGYSVRNNSFVITTKSNQLAEDIINLCFSLGFRVSNNKMKCKIPNKDIYCEYNRLNIYVGKTKIPIKLKRKNKRGSTFYLSPNRVAIKSIETNGGEVYGFSLDSPSKWYITDNWTITHNSAKSTNAMAIARYIDPSFPGKEWTEEEIEAWKQRKEGEGLKVYHDRLKYYNPYVWRHCDRIVFTFDQFIHAIDTSAPRQVIIFDEAVNAMNSQDAGSEMQKILIKKMTMIRKKRLYIFIVIPNIFMLRRYFAVARARALIHFYSPDGIQRGYFRFYNYNDKRRLYFAGIKDWNMSAVAASFKGDCVDTTGFFFDMDEYEAKKDKAIIELTEGPKKEKAVESDRKRTLNDRDAILVYEKRLWFNDQFRKANNKPASTTDFMHWIEKKYPYPCFKLSEESWNTAIKRGKKICTGSDELAPIN